MNIKICESIKYAHAVSEQIGYIWFNYTGMQNEQLPNDQNLTHRKWNGESTCDHTQLSQRSHVPHLEKFLTLSAAGKTTKFITSPKASSLQVSC